MPIASTPLAMPLSSCSPRSPEASAPILGRRPRSALTIQRRISQLTGLVLWPLTLAWLKHVRGYRIHGLRSVREQARSLLRQAQAPVLVCPNHLTWIDSLLVQWAISSPRQLLTRFRLFAWNIPEQANINVSIWLRLACYVAKCLPIRRGGERRAQQQVLDKLDALLLRRELVMVFPEGERSPTGRVDAEGVSYGAGRIANSVPGCRILCVYLRGDKQRKKSILPDRNQAFSLRFALIDPVAPRPGLRATRTTARQIGQTLARLEEEHFEEHDAGWQ